MDSHYKDKSGVRTSYLYTTTDKTALILGYDSLWEIATKIAEVDSASDNTYYQMGIR